MRHSSVLSQLALDSQRRSRQVTDDLVAQDPQHFSLPIVRHEVDDHPIASVTAAHVGPLNWRANLGHGVE